MYKSREIREFRENAERISQITQTIFNENFSFRTHFRWLNEIFAKEIERKFGIPTHGTISTQFIWNMNISKTCNMKMITGATP